MLTRRERERADANRTALGELRRVVAPDLRAAGFRKASVNTWRLDRPEIAVRFQLELGSRSEGPWAAVGGMLQGLVAASPTPAKPFRDAIFDSQTELAGRDDPYQVASDEDRADFQRDLLQHSLPWLLRYESFEDIWRALLHAELPGAMLPDRPARPKFFAKQSLDVAHRDLRDSRYVDEAIAYCWDQGMTFDASMFDPDMADVVDRLPPGDHRRG